jgi:hypothetical protein
MTGGKYPSGPSGSSSRGDSNGSSSGSDNDGSTPPANLPLNPFDDPVYVARVTQIITQAMQAQNNGVQNPV